MKLNEDDLRLIDLVVTERIDQHYAAHQEETRADRQALEELDEQYWEVLDRLPDEDADVIHAFHDKSFWMGAAMEKTLYKCGVLDGLRLAKAILELE
jgi:hypothetical protein